MAVSGGLGAELFSGAPSQQQEDRDLQAALAMAGDEEINQQYDKMTPEVDEGSEIRRETNCMDEEGSQR